jgi:CRISPR-associated protein Csx10
VSELVLTLRQPAQLGSKARRDNVLSSLEHIPGSVVRGALAAAWLARNGVSRPGTPEREEFLTLFEGGVRYGPLLRGGTEFMSLAVVGHKYDPEPGSCQVVDYDRAMGDEPPLHCPDCGSPLEQRRGLTGEREAPRRRTSVAISPAGTAEEGALFTRETLGAGQVFRGTVTAADDTLLKTLDGLGPVRIGGRRTTHGLADIAITADPAPPLPQRRPDGMLVVRLRSPGIFTDSCGRPSRDPSGEELAEALGGVGARVVQRWTRWEQAGGWHAASGLPKQQELTVAAGSTYVISTERPVVHAALTRLAGRGLGLRRHEGFGDLAPPPVLRPGAAARRKDAEHRRELRDRAAPLVRMLMASRAGEVIRALMKAHADEDAQASGRLRTAGSHHPDADVRTAMEFFLGLPPADAAYLAEELGR